MIKDMLLTWDYIKAKYNYLHNSKKYHFTFGDKHYYFAKVLTVKLNGELYLLEIHPTKGIALLEFNNIRFQVCSFEPSSPTQSVTCHLHQFFNDLKLTQIPNGEEDSEEIEFDKEYLLRKKN